jgi:hypothetical protein
MKKYTSADISYLRYQLLEKLGYITIITPEIIEWNNINKEAAPVFDFFWAPATDRQKTQIIVTLLGKHGQFGISEDEDVFPSDKLITQIRLVLP